MAVEFSQEAYSIFQDTLKRYPTKKAALLPILHQAQKEFGYISQEAVEYVAGLLELTPAEVEGVVTFYTMYFRKQMGKHVIQVCGTLSCSLLGSKHIVEHISKKLNIEPGETTEDDKFSLLKVECLGSCGTAPMMQINEDYYEDLTAEKVDEILDKLS
jgi:NADH-quinone oxidoreductase subunit E